MMGASDPGVCTWSRGARALSKSKEKHGFTPVEELSLCILITKRVYTFTALFPGFLVPGERSPPCGAVAVVKRGRVVAASCSRGGDACPKDWPLQQGLRGRDLAGGDGGGLCLASRRVLVTQRVLAAAEGCDHAVTELEEREARGEAGGCQAAPAAGLPPSLAELLGSPHHCSAGGAMSVEPPSLLPALPAAQGRREPAPAPPPT